MMIRMLRLPLLGLFLGLLLLTGCQTKPTLASTSVGCHSKHINCARFTYHSLADFNTSLAAHIGSWNLKVRLTSRHQPHDRGLHISAADLQSLADYKVAVRKRPGDIYLLVRQAREQGYSPYQTFLLEQVFLRSILDLRRTRDSL